MPLSSANKSLLITLLIILGTYVLLLAKPPLHLLEFEKQLTLPITIDESHSYKNKLLIDGIAPIIKFEVGADHPVSIYIDNQKQKCNSAECKFIVSTDKKIIVLEVSAEKSTQLTHLKYVVTKYRNKTTLSKLDSKAWLYIFLGILFLLIFCRIFYSNVSLTEWVVVAFVMAFFAINDIIFSFIFLGYLFLLFNLRNKLNGSHVRAIRILPFVISAIAFLLLFKYGRNFALAIFANPGEFNLVMPLGISYFVMRIIDTQLRWYRGQCLDMSFREIIFFIIFPGTLIAGPIENLQDFYKNRLSRIGREDYSYGISRILIGLFKKIVIADANLKVNYDLISAITTDPSLASGSDIFTFSIINMLFAYVDFSAYSDIAIGLSRLFGFKICENFNFPIFAENIREYWKRWHMSLSEWSFRNIYFPLLVITKNSYVPLFVTMMTIGFWHAFNLSWFSWAIHHASGMSIVALLKKHLPCNQRLLFLMKPLRIAITLIFVSMGFIFVYFDNYSIALTLYINSWKWLLFLGS